jgi:hypothetical protein
MKDEYDRLRKAEADLKLQRNVDMEAVHDNAIKMETLEAERDRLQRQLKQKIENERMMRKWNSELREALHEEETRCTWTYNDGYDLDYWETSCGEEFCFHNDGSLEDNKTVYCSFCGKRVLEKREDEQETCCSTYRKCQVCRQDYPAPPDCTGLVCFHCMSSDTES